jgi:hypothetical protein
MFEHVLSGMCRFGKSCLNKLCSFQHEQLGNDIEDIIEKDLLENLENTDTIQKTDKLLKCDDCDYITRNEKDLDEHIDELHEEWKVTQSLCDHFCRGEHGIHICWSEEDFEEWKGFDVWDGTHTSKTGDSVFKCLECKFLSESVEAMKQHIVTFHNNKGSSKCSFCEFKDQTWKGMRKHFKINHMEPDDYSD